MVSYSISLLSYEGKPEMTPGPVLSLLNALGIAV